MTVSITQARQRFQLLPEELQDAIFSVQTAEIIRKACVDNHLPEEKIPTIAESVGLVLLGFIHVEDLQTEIAARTNIQLASANTIAQAIIPRLLAPLKSILDRAYAPVPKDEETIKPAILTDNRAEKPKIAVGNVLEKIQSAPRGPAAPVFMGNVPPLPPPQKFAAPIKIAPQPINLPIVEKEPAKPTLGMTPKIIPQPVSTLVAEKEAIKTQMPSSVGISHTTAMPPLPPKPPVPLKAPEAKSVVPAAFSTETKFSLPKGEEKPIAPPPMILHKETEIMPVKIPSSLKPSNMPPKNLLEEMPKLTTRPSIPPARIEFEKKETGSPRIVNYSAKTTPVASDPRAPSTATVPPNIPPSSGITPSAAPKISAASRTPAFPTFISPSILKTPSPSEPSSKLSVNIPISPTLPPKTPPPPSFSSLPKPPPPHTPSP